MRASKSARHPLLGSLALLGLCLSVLPACSGDDAVDGGGSDGGVALEPTYENVAMVLGRSCTFTNSCHGGPGRGQGNLNFMVTDVTTVLNGVASCTYDAMPRVDPGSPDTSWMMVKMSAPADAMDMIEFTADPGWVPDTSDPLCPGDGNFGLSMPYGAPRLPDNEVQMIRAWITNGAPGPGGT